MDGQTPEVCGECGFDGGHWSVRDAGTLFGALGYWWRLATAGVGVEHLNRRPGPGVWSALEYGLHSALVTAVNRTGVELILAEDGCALPDPPALSGAEPGDGMRLEPAAVLADLEREGDALAVVTKSRVARWDNVGWLGDQPIQAGALLLHAAHDASHHFMDVARGLASLGAGTPAGIGEVARINASAGGVPKAAVANGRILWDGLDGDVQADRKHHGRPFQALCLWSTEVLDELARAGHPIGPGSAGENVTISGLDWALMRPGTRMRIGSALVELSYPAVPCQKQTAWFSDGDFARISHERNPQWARWYAWVRAPGEVATGDQVIVQP